MLRTHLSACYTFLLLCVYFFTGTATVTAQEKPITVSFEKAPNSFPLAVKSQVATFIYDSLDAEVVAIAVKALKKDIKMITGIEAGIAQAIAPGGYPVIIGTPGKSSLIDQLVKSGKLSIAEVSGKWETFGISLVPNPVKGVEKALVIYGSDARGTAFGVFELSRMIGVSPLVWWADVTPAPRKEIYLAGSKSIYGPPSVKYRGIFINDEDWGMHPWAAKHMDTVIKDIGPRTYEKVFELMLRMKANYIWPAMHPCTKSFWYYPENPELARKYSIVLGASHCEPLLRGNVFEWSRNFEQEYGEKRGEWRYDVNRKQIDRYWNDRVIQSRNNPAVYTVGMRGIHDSDMPGPDSKEEKKKLLEEVIRNQRNLLRNGLGKPAADVPQIFCPYKEVLDLYRLGMELPEDITLAWADDNYGYIRQCSDPQEQKRSGGSGVYYHFSYWGAPEDFLWLSTISPALTSYELTKAYQLNARRLWVFNVGDIKPAEMEMQFAMDLAWDVQRWRPEKAYQYPEHWAAETFGKEAAKSIASIKEVYYRLAASGKPEHLDRITFTPGEIKQRLDEYHQLVSATKEAEAHIPERLKDAWFQLLSYPVLAAAAMNEKVLCARESLRLAAAGDSTALAYAERSESAYKTIQQLTTTYNKEIADGKWDGMMDAAPRKRKIFEMPAVATPDMIKAPVAPVTAPVITIPAAAYLAKGNDRGALKTIEGLGAGKSGLTVWPMLIRSFSEKDIATAPYADYKVPVVKGRNRITVRCLPDFPLYNGMDLRCAVAVNGGAPVFMNLANPAETPTWAVNLLRGYAEGETTCNSDSNGERMIRIYFPDPGLVVNSITVSPLLP